MSNRLHSKAQTYFADLGPNFMTPDVISYQFSGRWAVELSEGEDFCRKPIYGTTFINAYTGEQTKTLSKMFRRITDAKKHIKKMDE